MAHVRRLRTADRSRDGQRVGVMRLLLGYFLVARVATSTPSPPPSTIIFHHSTRTAAGDFFPCIRIPSAIWLNNSSGDGAGTVLAFAECRRWAGDGCEPTALPPRPYPSSAEETNRYVCMKASTDGGRTFGTLEPNITKMRSTNPAAVSIEHITPGNDVASSTKVLLFFDAPRVPLNATLPMVVESNDDGAGQPPP